MTTSEGRVLVLLRHGQSTANANDTFSGWRDVTLTDRGKAEAARAAQLLEESELSPQVVHTSLLGRAIMTADLVTANLGRPWLPVFRTWRLNERHYGALQGRARAEVRAEVGDDEFHALRRGYDRRPPPLDPHEADVIAADARYAHLPAGTVPAGEALADVLMRVLPYWQDVIAADVDAGRQPLVVAHGNSLRALCMILDQLSPAQVSTLNIPTGIPLRYDLDHRWTPRVFGGSYLDPDAARAGAAEVSAQGSTRLP